MVCVVHTSKSAVVHTLSLNRTGYMQEQERAGHTRLVNMQYNKILYQVVHVKDGHGLSGFNPKSNEDETEEQRS